MRSKHKPWGAITELEEYLSLFDDAPQDSIIGEISTNYYAYPKSAQLIYEHIPEVKIIAILRDPSERAFSSYQMSVRAGHEKRNFSYLFLPDVKYIKRGFYYSELIPFFDIFDSSKIKILLYEDLCKNPIDFIQDIFEYVGVDRQLIPDMSTRGRVGGLPKNKSWHYLLNKPNLIRSSLGSIIKLFIPLEVRQNIRSKLIDKNVEKVKLSPEIRSKLIQIYRNEIIELQSMIERDLSAWLK